MMLSVLALLVGCLGKQEPPPSIYALGGGVWCDPGGGVYGFTATTTGDMTDVFGEVVAESTVLDRVQLLETEPGRWAGAVSLSEKIPTCEDLATYEISVIAAYDGDKELSSGPLPLELVGDTG